MIQVTDATFEDGVFKPDLRLELRPHSRVRLVVEALPEDAETMGGQQVWEAVEQLWQKSSIDSHGVRLSRAELHERR